MGELIQLAGSDLVLVVGILAYIVGRHEKRINKLEDKADG